MWGNRRFLPHIERSGNPRRSGRHLARPNASPPKEKGTFRCPFAEKEEQGKPVPRRQGERHLPALLCGGKQGIFRAKRRKFPPHRGQSPLWKNAAIQAVPVTRAPAPYFPQVVDRGRAGILQWRKQRRTKGEWSHEAGTDRTRTLRLRQ